MSQTTTAGVALRPLAEFTLLETLHALEQLGAEANNAAPAGFDAGMFDYRYRADHLDRVSSLAALAEGRIVGLLLAARRGGTTHVSGLVVAPSQQRRGIASAMLGRVVTEARHRGDTRLIVEVIADDAQVGAFYARHGFRRVRGLCGYARTAPAEAHEHASRVVPVDTTVVASAVAAHAGIELPWFYHPATLYGASAPARGYALDGVAHCIVVAKPSHLTIRTLIVASEHRRRGLGTALLHAVIRLHGAPVVVVQPLLPDDHCTAFLAASGFEPTATRHDELELTLA